MAVIIFLLNRIIVPLPSQRQASREKLEKCCLNTYTLQVIRLITLLLSYYALPV